MISSNEAHEMLYIYEENIYLKILGSTVKHKTTVLNIHDIIFAIQEFLLISVNIIGADWIFIYWICLLLASQIYSEINPIANKKGLTVLLKQNLHWSYL